ncbi:MAG TPA: hypothetical protein VF086_21440 [Propionibacteriaceae bacterium]
MAGLVILERAGRGPRRSAARRPTPSSKLRHIVVMPSRVVLVACVLAVTEEQRHVRGADATSPYVLQYADNPCVT